VRAVVLDPDGTLSLRDRPKPAAGDECLIRVTAAGICGTDLEMLRGYAGFSGVPGHEFVGVVEEAGAADAGWIGRRVAGEITVGCGHCDGCRAAGRGHCDVRTVAGIRGRDGAFAEYLRLPSVNLHALPASLDDDGVFVETAAACRVVEQVRSSGTRAAVVAPEGRTAGGAGPAGTWLKVTIVVRCARRSTASTSVRNRRRRAALTAVRRRRRRDRRRPARRGRRAGASARHLVLKSTFQRDCSFSLLSSTRSQ
jgi:threonine dehydrogenase-like Zn-dependent dehydrogenase